MLQLTRSKNQPPRWKPRAASKSSGRGSVEVTSVDNATVRTRASLVEGLQTGDEVRWREFCRLYGPVIRGSALKAGCTETEAEEVVQETCIGVASVYLAKHRVSAALKRAAARLDRKLDRADHHESSNES